ncbi:MAG: hypothetical protein WEB60_07320 [Terrimicrobiaceae bacterium]
MKRVEKIFSRTGMKTGGAFNIFLVQVELGNDMTFPITAFPERLLTTGQQGKLWQDAFVEH